MPELTEMEKIREVIHKWMDSIRLAIIQTQKAKGLTASGKSAAGLRVQTPEPTVGEIVDTLGVFRFQDYPFGRRPTTGGKGNPTLREVIYQWLAFKKYGLNWKDEKERKSLSWAISTNIHKKGNYIHRNKRTTGVVTEPVQVAINSEFFKMLSTEVGKAYLNDLLKQLTPATKIN